eukprot:SAG11_NODE_1213_length_5506_cov_2.953579_9_plen_162_part_01
MKAARDELRRVQQRQELLAGAQASRISSLCLAFRLQCDCSLQPFMILRAHRAGRLASSSSRERKLEQTLDALRSSLRAASPRIERPEAAAQSKSCPGSRPRPHRSVFWRVGQASPPRTPASSSAQERGSQPRGGGARRRARSSSPPPSLEPEVLAAWRLADA